MYKEINVKEKQRTLEMFSTFTLLPSGKNDSQHLFSIIIHTTNPPPFYIKPSVDKGTFIISL